MSRLDEFMSWLDENIYWVLAAIVALALAYALGRGRTRREAEEKSARGGRRLGPFRPLPLWAVVIALAIGIAATKWTWDFLLAEANQATSATAQAQLRIEAARTALAVGVGTGGLAALLLSARRQWLGERDHIQRDDFATAEQHDATERRVTDLYSSAIGLLANESAAVRLGALYALERLAQTNPEHRPTIVDLICGYLRLRKDLSVGSAGSIYRVEDLRDPLWIPGREESEVRATAQRILLAHLSKPRNVIDSPQFWQGIRLDLHGAKLENFSLRECEVVDADFRDVEFWGTADFALTNFAADEIYFDRAVFRGQANFAHVDFAGYAGFSDAQFCERAEFEHSTFGRGVGFYDATFWDTFMADWIRVQDMSANGVGFLGDVYLRNAEFYAAQFDDAVFHGVVQMHDVKCGYAIRMIGSTFHEYIDLGNDDYYNMRRARIRKEIRLAPVELCAPEGWIVNMDAPGDFASFVRAPEDSEQPIGPTGVAGAT